MSPEQNAAPETQPQQAAQKPPCLAARCIGSARAGVVLMAVLAAVLVAATFYEKAAGTIAAQRHFYGALWFRILLGLIALSILAALLRAILRKKGRAGFYVTHAALLVILAGGLATALWRVEGTIVLADGEKTDEMRADETEFLVSDESGSAVVPVPGPNEKPLETGSVLATLPSGRRFVFVDFYSNCEPVPVFVNDPAAPVNPALRVAVYALKDGQSVELREYMLAYNDPFDPQSARVVKADFDLILEAAASDEDARRIIDDTGSGPMTLTLLFPRDPRIYSFPLERMDADIKAPGRDDITLRMLECLPNAKESAEGYVNDPDGPLNPALKFRLTGADGRAQEITVLASRTMLIKAAEPGMPWDLSWVIFSGNAHRRRFVVIQGPDEKLRYKYVRGDGTAESGKIDIGKDYPLDYEDLSLKFLEHLPHARMEMRYELAPPTGFRDWLCIYLKAVSGAEEEPMVVPLGARQSAQFADGGKVQAEFRQKRLPMPFTLELTKTRGVAESGEEIGTESDVVAVEKSGTAGQATIRVNEPLRIAGYKVFQTTPPGQRNKALSQFMVVRDPGLNIIYAGCGLLMVGIIITFLTKTSRKGDNGC